MQDPLANQGEVSILGSGVFHSRFPDGEVDWARIYRLGAECGRPLAIFALQDHRQDCPPLPLPIGWSLVWLPIPDGRFEVSGLGPGEQGMMNFFRTAGTVASAYYSMGYALWFHCLAGVSRSAAAHIAFRMVQFKETYDEAVGVLRTERPSTRIYPGFRSALNLLADELAGEDEVLTNKASGSR